MGKKGKLTSDRNFWFIRKALVRRYGEDTTRKITVLAERHYADCEKRCQGATKGEWQHLSGTILPTVAVYNALLEMDAEYALPQTHAIMMEMCEKGGAVLGTILKLPGMKLFFMWMMPKMTVKLFGPSCGFRYKNFQACRRKLKMDMTACPYCRYAEQLGCPELMPVFCDSDFATYGNLPGIKFQRTQTLGTGGKCCDFRFIRES